MGMIYDQEIVEINGIPVLPLPMELIEDLGWEVGTGLELEEDGMGGVSLRRGSGEGMDDLGEGM